MSTRDPRQLTTAERQLLAHLIAHVPSLAHLLDDLESIRVQDMEDGGMGSIHVVGPEGRQFGGDAATAQYTDVDGVVVLISLILDEAGRFYELDFWKTDFSPLRAFPRPDQLYVETRAD